MTQRGSGHGSTEHAQGNPDAIRRETRRNRAVLIALAAGGMASVFAFAALPAARATGDVQDGSSPPAAAVTPSTSSGSASPTTTPSPTITPRPTPKPTPSIRPAVRPKFIFDPIPWGVDRRRQMAAYSMRHYGEYEWLLTPKQIVLHYTVSNTYKSVWWEWASPGIPYYAYGEYPRPAAHFVVDKDGTIYCTVPPNFRVRNAIGLNHVAIGIEFVEMSSADNILARNRQRNAGVALVRWLEYKYQIPKGDVIGHGFANSSRYFKDLLGRKNTHTDWNVAQVLRFRSFL